MMYMLRFILILLISCLCRTSYAESPKSWIVYYGDKEPAESFLKYDIVAFDRDRHPTLRQLQISDKTLLGYISLGEAETYRADYEEIKALGVLLEENPNWPGHFVVDVRNPIWTKHVIENIIPSILHEGFNGIMVDTLDSIEDLEVNDPEKYDGMTQAAVSMIKAIRVHYPSIKIMVNRGFNTLPAIAQDINFVLAESVLVEHQPQDKTYKLFAPEIYQEYVEKLKTLKTHAPHLTIVSVDYWDMKDEEGIKKIYDTHRQNGYLPYVTTIDLSSFHPEKK